MVETASQAGPVSRGSAAETLPSRSAFNSCRLKKKQHACRIYKMHALSATYRNPKGHLNR